MSRPADSPAYHELDFLIGSWDVLNVEGEKTAQTIFRKSEGGYLIEEKWVAVHADGGSGTGISFYDPSNKVWKHTRIDDTGRVIEYSGAVDGSSMQMTERVKHPNGECKLSRLTLELKASDLVVRRVENSEDDGASWTIQFTGTFRRSRT